ncbi:MAG TPA: hypothetical protein VGP76_07760 [Planctomycetaceae bacterium]|jgi:hypothetical protein|nr:hypothetical protein [Planctomycetaceae bacterium]
MKIQQLVVLASCVYLAALVATVYFARATTRRVLGAVAGGLAVAVVGFGVEVVCQALGFWRYPSEDTGYGPLPMYPLLVLAWGVLSLIGWRVIRRFGWRGEVVFLAVVAAQGTLRDYIEAGQALGVIAFAPGIGTLLLDVFLWGALTALAQGVMRLVAGPAAADPLSRPPKKANYGTATAERDNA